jgi:hypothetical protein
LYAMNEISAKGLINVEMRNAGQNVVPGPKQEAQPGLGRYNRKCECVFGKKIIKFSFVL